MTFQADNLSKGDKIETHKKTWTVLGKAGLSRTEVFLTDGTKYPVYVTVYDGTIDSDGFTTMDCTVKQLKKAHNF